MRLHHFFLLTCPGAPEAAALTALGLVEGPANDHPGQGTANRRFFFGNSALELLFVRDEEEARTGPARELRFAERQSMPHASPFGLVFERGQQAAADFPGWPYQPDYFPAGVTFLVGENSTNLAEPLCICMPDSLAPPSPTVVSPPPFATVTGVTVHVPDGVGSRTLQRVARVRDLEIQAGDEHLMEIVFGERAHGKTHDLRPTLPLVLHC